jgi:hypothetical protein
MACGGGAGCRSKKVSIASFASIQDRSQHLRFFGVALGRGCEDISTVYSTTIYVLTATTSFFSANNENA